MDDVAVSFTTVLMRSVVGRRFAAFVAVDADLASVLVHLLKTTSTNKLPLIARGIDVVASDAFRPTGPLISSVDINIRALI